jgi:hypothetical protein
MTGIHIILFSCFLFSGHYVPEAVKPHGQMDPGQGHFQAQGAGRLQAKGERRRAKGKISAKRDAINNIRFPFSGLRFS